MQVTTRDTETKTLEMHPWDICLVKNNCWILQPRSLKWPNTWNKSTTNTWLMSLNTQFIKDSEPSSFIWHICTSEAAVSCHVCSWRVERIKGHWHCQGYYCKTNKQLLTRYRCFIPHHQIAKGLVQNPRMTKSNLCNNCSFYAFINPCK